MTFKESQTAPQQELPATTTPSLRELFKIAAPPSTSNFPDWCSPRVVSLPTHTTPCNRMLLKSNLSSKQSQENLAWQKPYCFQTQHELRFHSYKKTWFHLSDRSQIVCKAISESSQTKLQQNNDPFKPKRVKSTWHRQREGISDHCTPTGSSGWEAAHGFLHP